MSTNDVKNPNSTNKERNLVFAWELQISFRKHPAKEREVITYFPVVSEICVRTQQKLSISNACFQVRQAPRWGRWSLLFAPRVLNYWNLIGIVALSKVC